MVCISFTEGDVIHLPSRLLCRPLVHRVCVCEWSFPCFSNIAVLGSPYFFDEVRSAEDGPDLARRFHFVLVIARLGPSITDVVSEVPVMDEFLDLILKHDALLCGMSDILVISIILILVSFGAFSWQRIRPLIDVCLFCGQEYLFTRPS